MGLHVADKTVEQRRHIMWAWARFWVPLETKGRLISTLNTLQRAIKQRLVSSANSVRQADFRYRETVVLAGNHNHLGVHVLHWVVSTMMAKLHFFRLRARCQSQQLVA